MSGKKLQIGAVGLGRGSTAIEIAQKFASKVNIAAICDINKEKADNCASRFGINNVYYDYEEMLKDKSLDAIYVATPIPSHAKHCIQAFEAGKHVLSEVTCITDLQDAEPMIQAQEKSGKIYMLAENYCYLKAWNMVMKMVKAGLFGEIYYAEGDYLMNFHQRAGFPYVGGWRQNVYHMHRGHVYITHSLGPLMQAFDYEPLERVTCMGSGSYPHAWGLRADNTCNLLIQTKSNKMIRLRQDFLSLRPDKFLFYAIQGVNGVYEGGRSYPGAYHEGDRREKQDAAHKVSIKGLCSPNEWIDLFSLKEFLPDMSEGWLPDEEIRKYGVYNEGVGVMFNDFASVITGEKENELTLKRTLNWTAAGLRSEESADRDGDPVAITVY
jgi:predicted dehydrogenase